MSPRVRWTAGAPAVHGAVERWLGAAAEPAAAEVLRDNPRRRLVRLPGPAGEALLVKQFRIGSGRHPLRERIKARLGFAPADREWRALARLHAAGVAVPEPLALGTLPDGDRLLVERFVPGRLLAEALGAPPAERRKTLEALGVAVASLHAAGFLHGDLHHGNVMVTARGPVLLDLQHARAASDEGGRLRDLGHLDHALSEIGSRVDRARVHAAALGATRPFSAGMRGALRQVAAAGHARALEHAQSRTRRSLRPGRAYAKFRHASGIGLRCADVDIAALAAALAAHAAALAEPAVARAEPAVAREPAVLKRDARARTTAVRAGERRVVIKEHVARGLGRALADGLRGSAGWRAWRGGHGLLARGIGAARPLAYLEQRRLGLVRSSVIVLEDVRPAWPADRPDPPVAPGEVVRALGRLATALHRLGVDHGDLKASHVLLEAQAGAATGTSPLATRLIDLEGVRFARRLSDARRLRALAQLNASLPDVYPAPARSQAFGDYVRALPFGISTEAARARVVRESLARRHRWSGAGCAPPSV